MRKIVALLLLSLLPVVVSAQKAQPFVGYIVNKEYNVYIRMDFYQNSVVVPGQSIFGELPGFFGDNQDGRKWLFTSAKVKGRQATLAITNDYGSEDLTATLTCTSDSTFTLRQEKGSTLKIARRGHWTKIPKEIEFKRPGGTVNRLP